MAALETLLGTDEFDSVESKLNLAIDALNLLSSTNTIATKAIAIGDWNILSGASISIAHGLTLSNILSVDGMIINDAGSVSYPIKSPVTTGFDNDMRVSATGTNIVITARGGGFFTSIDFDSTGYNRGYILINYLK